MPWPVTHVIIADRFYDKYFRQLYKQSFIIGTCFPDIRYPAKTKRNLTHFREVTLQQIQGQESFKAGVLFHSLTDRLWNTYMHEQDVYQYCEFNAINHHALKLHQDQVIYEKILDWQVFTKYFDTVLPQEGVFGIDEQLLRSWHASLANYMSKPPCQDYIRMLESSMPAEVINDIHTSYKMLSQESPLIGILEEFYNAVPLMMSSQPAEIELLYK
ncbi:MAG: hypothetical protein ABIG43_02195 [Chloroflexota bacterium]